MARCVKLVAEHDTALSARRSNVSCRVKHYSRITPHAQQLTLSTLSKQFFISPLMRPEASARELESIESEFNLSRSNDACRLQQLTCHTSRQGHPFTKVRGWTCFCVMSTQVDQVRCQSWSFGIRRLCIHYSRATPAGRDTPSPR
jgi:hypothetical protein